MSRSDGLFTTDHPPLAPEACARILDVRSKKAGERESLDHAPESISSEPGFNLVDYIPFQLVRTQLAMYRLIGPETHPDLIAIAKLSKGDIRILSLIAEEQASSPSEIVQIMSLDRAVITRHVATLVKAGLVRNEAAADDRRRRILRPTAKGRRFAAILFPIFEDFSRQIDSWITVREKKALMIVLNKLLQGCEATLAGSE